MRKTALKAAAAAICASLLLSCTQPTNSNASTPPAQTQSASLQAAGQVTATIKGVVLDGMGNPVSGVVVGYSDGANPAVIATAAPKSVSGARVIQNTTTDDKGIFELQYLSQTNNTEGGLGGTLYVSLKKDGYTGRRIPVYIPTVMVLAAQQVSIMNPNGTSVPVSINVGQTVQVDVTHSAAVDYSGIKTYVSSVIGGFHIASDLGASTMFKLGAEAVGYVALKNNDSDPNSSAKAPPANSIIAFNFPDSSYSPYVITAKTDATGKFLFGGKGVGTDGQPNPLPIFGANSNAANTTKTSIPESTTMWGSDNGPMSSMPYFSVQVASGQSDALGSAFYLINSASTSNGNLIPNLSFLTTDAANPQGLGSATTPLYAIADNRARVIAWTPQTVIDGMTVPMAQLTGTTPTPITLTFSKAMDTTNTPITGISLIAGGVNYWTIDSTLAWDSAKKVATLTPKLAFPKGANLSLAISGWLAGDGTAVSNTGLPTFAVQPGIILMGATWLDGSRQNTMVALNGTPSLTFNLAPASFDANATKLYDLGTVALPTTALVPAVFSISAANKQLVATPAAPLNPGDTYEIRFSVSSGVAGDPPVTYDGSTVPANSGFVQSQLRFVADTSNQLLLAATSLWSFNAGSGNPYVNNQFDGTKAITLTFNKKIATSPAPVITLVKTTGTVPVLFSLAWDSTGTIATLTPALSLASQTGYTVGYTVYADASTLTGSVAAGGISLASSIAFTTAKTSTIQLINSSTVAAGQVTQPALAVNTPIVLTYDTAVDFTKAPTFVLSTATPFAVSWNTAKTVATLTPVTFWANGTSYTLTAVVNADTLGVNTLTSNLTFTTAPTLTVAATIGTATTNFPVSGTPVVMTFNQPVKTTAGAFTITLFQDKAGTGYWYANNQVNVPTTVAWDATGTIATITPTTTLQLGTTYGVGFQVFATVGNGSLDNGNSAAGTKYGSFLGNAGNYGFTTVPASMPRLVSTNLMVNNQPATAFPYSGTAGANNITLTFDSMIPGSTVVAAANLVYGKTYVIATPGTTVFTLLGAANSTAGTVFTMSGGAGVGTGTAYPLLGYSAFLSGGASNPVLIGSFDTTGTILTLSTTNSANLTPNTSAYTLTYNMTNGNNGATGNKTLVFGTTAPVYASIPSLAQDVTKGVTLYDNNAGSFNVLVSGIDPLALYLLFEASSNSGSSWVGSGYIALTSGSLTPLGGGTYVCSFAPTGVKLFSGSSMQIRVRENFGTTATNDSPNSAVLAFADTGAPVAANVSATVTTNNLAAGTNTTAAYSTIQVKVTTGATLEPLQLPTISLYTGTFAAQTAVAAATASVYSTFLTTTTNNNDTLNIVIKSTVDLTASTYTVNLTGFKDATGNSLNNAATGGTKTTAGQIDFVIGVGGALTIQTTN